MKNNFIKVAIQTVFLSLLIGMNAVQGLAQPDQIASLSVTGKLVNQNGSGLPGLQLKLYTALTVCSTTSGSDGSFIFDNITGVPNQELPTGYIISGNQPNPFYSTTRIFLSLPKSGILKFDVFNAFGQQVMTGNPQNFKAGESYVDLEFNKLPAGNYIVRIMLNEKYTVSRKMLLLKGNAQGYSGVPGIKVKQISAAFKSGLSIKIDSLVVTGTSISKKVFTDLPEMSDSNLDLGNLTIPQSITINNPEVNSVSPCGFLILEGAGFDSTAVLSIRYFDGNGFSMTLPVANTFSTSVKVQVPPYVNLHTGNIEQGVVNIQIIQKSGSIADTSNTLPGIVIEALPDLSLPPGTIASNIAGFLELTLTDAESRLTQLSTSSGGQIITNDLVVKLDSLRILFGQLKDKIRFSMSNPGQPITVGVINGVEVTLSQENLRLADQWMLAVINGVLTETERKSLLLSHGKGMKSIALKTSGCSDDPALCAALETLTSETYGEQNAYQQYGQSVLPSARDRLAEVGKWVGLGTTAIGVTFALAVGSVPIGVLALLAAPNIMILAAQMDMDASTLAGNSIDKSAAQRVLDDFNDGLTSELNSLISPVLGAVSNKSGILFDLYTGIKPVFDDKIPAFLAQAKSFIVAKPDPVTYSGSFSGTTNEVSNVGTIKFDVSGTVTISIIGSGTLSDPYTGTIKFSGTYSAAWAVCNSPYTCGGGGTVPLNLQGTVSGTQSDLQGSISTLITFTGGTIFGNTLTGKLSFDVGCNYACADPIVSTITLTR